MLVDKDSRDEIVACSGRSCSVNVEKEFLFTFSELIVGLNPSVAPKALWRGKRVSCSRVGIVSASSPMQLSGQG